ncbi:MAG: hypothetical protein U1D31_00140 [Patescibacteria group bacterium]|nr:hypothetical protein [bacterium]MDZ4240529.1 hypothetical protein [Patescibacteria group bacterium]
MKRTLLVVVFFALLPILVFAQGGLIPCDGVDTKCGFPQLIELGNNIINFLVIASIPLAVISFIYAGFLYLTAGGNEGKIKQAHSIFWKVLWGFIIILTAWLIVQLIINAFLVPGYSLLEN